MDKYIKINVENFDREAVINTLKVDKGIDHIILCNGDIFNRVIMGDIINLCHAIHNADDKNTLLEVMIFAEGKFSIKELYEQEKNNNDIAELIDQLDYYKDNNGKWYDLGATAIAKLFNKDADPVLYKKKS